jgi:hypothetical protein
MIRARERNNFSHCSCPIDLQLHIYRNTTYTNLTPRLYGNDENSSPRCKDSSNESKDLSSTNGCGTNCIVSAGISVPATTATAAATTAPTPSVARRRDRRARRRRPDHRFLPVPFQSPVPVALRVASCPSPNRAHCRPRGLGERGEQLFLETSRGKNCLSSAGSCSKSGPTRPQPTSRRSPAAPSATPISSSKASASRTRVSLTSSSARSSVDRMVSRHRFDGVATPVIRHRTVQAVVHSVCSPVSGLRRACSLLLADDLPAPSAHICERVEPSGFCHASAWHHHLLSERGGALSPPCTGARHAGGVRDRGFRKGADGGSPASSQESQAKATRGKPGMAGADGAVRRNNRREGLRVGEPTRIGKLSWPALGRTSNVSDLGVTAGETAPSLNSANSFSVLGSARGTSAMLHPGAEDGSTASLAGRDSGDRAERRSANSVTDGAANGSLPSGESEPWVTLALAPSVFGSGGGLGIQQPGSMTRGTRAKVQTPSGRARNRAMCPAVARSFERRAA